MRDAQCDWKRKRQWLLLSTVGYLTQESGQSTRLSGQLIVAEICLCVLHSSLGVFFGTSIG